MTRYHCWPWGHGAGAPGKNGGNAVFGNSLEEDDLRPIFKAAVDKGLTFWDTAYVYGMGASEKILSTFTKESDKKIFLSHKIHPAGAPFRYRAPGDARRQP